MSLKTKQIFSCLLLCCSLVLFPAAFPACAQEEPLQKPRVLFISSYQLSFVTVPLQLKGIQSVLTTETTDLEVEFMDTKQFGSEQDIRYFYNSLKNKLNQLPPYDAVILGDDAALVFALNHQEELFPQIPLVFFAINDLELAAQAGENPYITGFVEETSQDANIRLARKLMPDASELVAIVDDTLTGQGDQKQIAAAIEAHPQLTLRFINSSQLTQEELVQALEAVNPDSIVFYLTMFEDSEQHQYTIRQSARLIARHVPAPVFRLSAGGVGDGLLGGIMFSYDTSGQMAAETVRQILEGVPVSSIPVNMESPNYGYFDCEVLEKYHLSPSLLPESSNLINKKPNFFQANHRVLIYVSIVCGISLLVISILLWNDIRRRSMLNHDPLTRLYSRHWMTHHMDLLIQRHQAFSAFMLDLDNFKWINDTLGHVYGDSILRQVADRLKTLDQTMVTAARFGGDEFFGFFAVNEPEPTRYLASRLLAVFDKPFLIQDRKLYVQASIGIARYPQDATSSDVLIANADLAMYTVKNTGKNSYRFFEQKMQESIHRQTEISVMLREALANDGFHLLYQPQLSLKDGRLTGFEALLRLNNQLISPGEFIPVAENDGMIIQIGRIVAEKAVCQIADWIQTGYIPVPVSINFSNDQIRDKDFPDFLDGLLRRYHIPPELIEIEITESTFLKRSEETRLYMEQLTKNGISLALDDFGSGYSAIRYLQFVSIQRLKLDKSLLDEYHNSKDKRMLAGIIHMAHDLDLEVISEGVETKEDARLLTELSCDFMQGYYFSRPVPPNKAAEYMNIQKA